MRCDRNKRIFHTFYLVLKSYNILISSFAISSGFTHLPLALVPFLTSQAYIFISRYDPIISHSSSNVYFRLFTCFIISETNIESE
jgi:hypothetical protein